MTDISSAMQEAPVAVIESRLESKLGKGPGLIGTAGFSIALQMATVRNLLVAWVLTLPASIVLSGTLFWAFSHFS